MSKEDLPYFLGKENDGWIMTCHGVGPVRTNDRAQAQHIFDMVARAYGLGRSDKASEIRQALGLEP